MSLGVGQISLLDLNDAIISGVAPSNPTVGQLWIDESEVPRLLKKWDGTIWVSLGEVPEVGTGELIEEIVTTLGNMANDNLLDFDERKTIKDKLLDIIGNASLLTDVTTTLPTASTLDSSAKGDFYNVRRSAVVSGVSTSHATYIAVATQYGNLKSYLEGLTPIKPWNLSIAQKDTNITVAKETFRTHWLNYYNAVNNLAIETSRVLKENADNIQIGGRNLLRNSNVSVNNSTSPTNTYTMTEKMEAVTYTLKIKGTLGNGKTNFNAYLDGGTNLLGSLVNNGDGTHSLTFTGKVNSANPSVIHIYAMPQSVSSASTITTIKLERGNRATDYTVAPEDIRSEMDIINGTLIQHSSSFITLQNEITSRVLTTTYEAGLATKEGFIPKSNTAPSSPLNGALWLDTTISPNILKRWNGTTWVKATPTTASEVGAYSTTEGNALAQRVTSAEGTLTVQAGQIASKVGMTEVTNSINGIIIGGRNLVPNATFKYDAEGWEIDSTNFAIVERDFRSVNALMLESTGFTSNVWRGASIPLTNKDHIKRNIDYVLSGWIYIYDDVPLDSQVGIEVRGKNATNTSAFASLGSILYPTTTPKNEWIYFERIMRNTTTDIVDTIINPWIEKNGKIKIAMLQVEEGNKVTKFNTAPEDTDSRVETMHVRLSNAEEIITSDSIVNTVMGSQTFVNVLGEKADLAELGSFASKDDLDTTAENIRGEIDLAIASQDFSPYVRQTDLIQTKDEFNFNISNSGGINLIRNSVGYSDKDFWDTTTGNAIQVIGNNELDTMGYGRAFAFSPASGFKSLRQRVNLIPNYKYTLSWYMNKLNIPSNPNNYVIFKIMNSQGQSINEIIYSDTDVTSGYVFNSLTFVATEPIMTVEVSGGNTSSFSVTGLMLNIGDVPLQWTMAHGEIYNTNVKININGIKVHNSSSSAYTIMSPEEFSGYAEVNGQMQRVFTLNDDVTEVSKLDADREISMSPIKIIPITNGGYNGWAFIKSE